MIQEVIHAFSLIDFTGQKGSRHKSATFLLQSQNLDRILVK